VSAASLLTVHRGERGAPCASVVTRRVYALPAFDGALSAGAPAPLVPADPDDPTCAGGDLVAIARPGTDVIVRAHAHSVDGPVPAMDVSVAVHDRSAPMTPRLFKRLRVFGDRSVTLDPLDRRARVQRSGALRRDAAHLGARLRRLRRAHRSRPPPPDGARRPPRHRSDLYRYPRNDVGCGYCVSAELGATPPPQRGRPRSTCSRPIAAPALRDPDALGHARPCPQASRPSPRTGGPARRGWASAPAPSASPADFTGGPPRDHSPPSASPATPSSSSEQPAATAGGFKPPRRASGERPSAATRPSCSPGMHPRRRQVDRERSPTSDPG
jgi:hypothetical protein